MSSTVKPYGESGLSRKEEITRMFDNIAGSYDFLNHFLSMGIDILWRRKAIRMLKLSSPDLILDIATGTGDFALEAMKTNPKKIIGLDISKKMLELGKEKIKKRGLENQIEMVLGESENLPFQSDSADAVTVGFGARNFENLEQGLREILRVLKPGGRAAILEPSFPNTFPLKQFFGFYFRFVLPMIGRLISKDKSAYTYLPQSVEAFPEANEFTTLCSKIGFRKATWHPLTLGICALYMLEK